MRTGNGCCWLLAGMVLLLCWGAKGQQSFNEVCGPNQHCVVDSGLICEAGKCQCGSGKVNQDVKYDMAWDAGAKVCVGKEGGACIGNWENPVVGDTMKKVGCLKGLECVQVKGLPWGVGVCAKGDEFGSACGPTLHCAGDKGLICEQGKCQCGSAAVTNELRYLMRWDEETRECVGTKGGACVGNAMNPVEGSKMKRVRCESGVVCEQMEGLPPGVGVCGGEDKNEEPSPSPSPTPEPDSSVGGMVPGHFVVASSLFLVVMGALFV